MEYSILLSHIIDVPWTESVIRWEDLRDVNEFYGMSINEILIKNTINRAFEFNGHVSFHCNFRDAWLYFSNCRVFFENFAFAYSKIRYSSRYASVSMKYFFRFIYIIFSLIILNFSQIIIYGLVCAVLLLSFINCDCW